MKVLMVCLFLFSVGFAKNFDTRAYTFPIEEANILKHMQSQASKSQKQLSPDLAKKASEPAPLDHITECTESRTWTYTPKYTAKEDIRNLDGKLIVEKGETFNPLEFVQPRSKLLFVDGTKQKHIDWALKQGSNIKIILVKGKPLELESQLGRPVYFDQMGRLVAEFGIKQVPARVFVNNDSLIIEELTIEDISK